MNRNMPPQERNFQELALFINDHIREHIKSITKETSIENDLGITGEEAAELMSAFSRKFKVDISNFIFEKYFNDEPTAFTFPRKFLPFTIGHLEKAMTAGRLDEEVINN